MYKYKAKIINIVDGDTFDAEVDVGFSITVTHRFVVEGIDTPETWRPRNEAEKEHGQKATNRAKELLLDKQVIIKSSKFPGIYNRYGATVTLPDGQDYTEIMISEGFEKKVEY